MDNGLRRHVGIEGGDEEKERKVRKGEIKEEERVYASPAAAPGPKPLS